MKILDRVAIVCDNKLLDEALALRAVLESYGIQVDFHRFIQKRQIFAFFAHPHPEHSHTILVCHGSGGDEDPYLMFEVVDQAEGRYDDPDGWDGITVRWTAAEVLAHVGGGRGTVLSLACGSGRAPLARAFLKAGFQAYIGPVSHYLDVDSALVFAINFFYFLLAEDRDYAPARYGEPEAVKKAAAVDAGWAYGTESFSFFPG